MIREIDSRDYCTLSPAVQSHMTCRYCDTRATHIKIGAYKHRVILCTTHAERAIKKEDKS